MPWLSDSRKLFVCYAPDMSYSLGAATASGGRWGQIVTKDGFRYQITEEDVLWAGRAANCEGGGEDGEKAALWTWTGRFTLPSYRRRFRTLASLIRAHSQPVNPIWQRTGSKCGPGGQYHGSARFCNESQLQRRERCATTSWGSLKPSVRDSVTKWATAKLANPVPKAVDFASSSIGHSADDVEVARFKSPGSRYYNVFYSEAASRSRPADFVQIEHEGSVAGPSMRGLVRAAPIIGIVALTGAAGFAGWAYWKYGRR